MSVLSIIAKLLPASVVHRINRLQYQLPFLQPLIQKAASSLRRGPHTIEHGVAKGLTFDPQGGNPGYALGTSGLAEQNILAKHLQRGQVFYDLGANKGFYAIIGAHLVGPKGLVYAFEPFPKSAAAIRANADLNDFDNIAIWEAAVSSETKTEQFVIEGDSIGFKLANSHTHHTTGKAKKINVDVYAIDDLVDSNRLQPPDFVMMDVEGSEVSALWGMEKTIRTFRPAILCEVHWIHEDFRTLVDQLFTPLNYNVSQIDGSPLPETPSYFHALMTPQ